MRSLVPCFLLVAVRATAQFSDPGFEDGGVGWSATCGYSFSTDVPPYGGSNCISLPMFSATQPDCYYTDGIQPFIYQELPGLQNGDQVLIQFWYRAEPDLPANAQYMHTAIIIGWMTSSTTFDYDESNPQAFSGASNGTTVWAQSTAACTLSGIPPGATPAVLLGGHAFNNTNGTIFYDNVRLHTTGTGASILPKVWLDGCYVQAQNLMRDDLRIAGFVPTTEPYTAMGYEGSGGETTTPAVLAVTGTNAIVDWVHLDLRFYDPESPVALASRNALLQRDGDIVATDGVSPVTFAVGRGNYYVVVRHRNHLPVMSSLPLGLNSAPITFDLRSPSTPLFARPAPYTDVARKTVGNTRTLWAGNVHIYYGLAVIYAGTGNDRDLILGAIGGVVPTNTVTGYNQADVNMDGVVKYSGANNDRDVILSTIGGIVPTNLRNQQVPGW